MSNLKGTANIKNFISIGRPSVLPPKGPFQSIPHSDADYGPPSAGSKSTPKSEGYRLRKCTSSQGILFDEQPSWLDELLNEPEMPVKRGTHRRASSDSSTYLALCTHSHDIDNTPWQEYKSGNMASVPLWGSLDFDHFHDAQLTSHAESSLGGEQNIPWESPLNPVAYPSRHVSLREKVTHQHSGPSCSSQELDGVPSLVAKKQDQEESHPHDSQDSSKKGDYNFDKLSSACETDQKRAKQQFAQRSRVRKLQYIAELERTVQAMQAEGCEVAAELEFLGHQNIILNMENKALKQRLDSLAQEQLIKHFQQELLEGEIGRLQALFYQQQQPQTPQPQPQPSGHHRRSSSRETRDLDAQLAILSLRHKETNSGWDSTSGSLRI